MNARTPPRDHLPKSLRDSDCLRRDAEVETRRALFRDAKAVTNALRSVTERQSGGALSRAEAVVLVSLLRANLRACARRELFYRPTREGIAKETGYSLRTVSRAITRLKDLGLVNVARYAKGGRLGDTGKGLATEFRSGGLAGLVERLAGLGYRIGTRIAASIRAAVAWATARTTPLNRSEPTGTLCPGTLGKPHRTAPELVRAGQADPSQAGKVAPRGRLGALASRAFAAIGAGGRSEVEATPPMVPMTPIAEGEGFAGGSYARSLCGRGVASC